MRLAEEATKTLEKVVPRLYVNLPRGATADVTVRPQNLPVDRPFIADLAILYAFDVGEHFELVANRDLRRLGLTLDELHENALQNLRALSLEIQAHQADRITMLTAGGNYEATLLLLPEVWQSVTPLVSGELIACVPARNVLYVTGDASLENLAELRQWTSRMLEQSEKPLSRAFLRWNGARWEEYRGFAE